VRLPSMPRECWSVGRGLAASLQTVCAASVPRPVDQRLTTASTRGTDCTVGGHTKRRRSQSEEVMTWSRSETLELVGALVDLVIHQRAIANLAIGCGDDE